MLTQCALFVASYTVQPGLPRYSQHGYEKTYFKQVEEPLTSQTVDTSSQLYKTGTRNVCHQ